MMKRNIVLVGAMGSGKSHLGRNLAKSLGWQYVDTDRVLEKEYNQSISEIYKELGEAEFRKEEIRIINKVMLYHEAIISIGGNLPMEKKLMKTLFSYSYVIGIRAAHYQIVRRVNRKIGKRPTIDYEDVSSSVDAMLKQWRPVYYKCDYVLDTTKGHTEQFIKKISQDIKRKNIQFKERVVKERGQRDEKNSSVNKRRGRSRNECGYSSRRAKSYR